MRKGKHAKEAQPVTEPVQPTTEPLPQQSAVDVEADVTVDHDSHGHSHMDTDRDVTVERTTDIDWTIDYGGDPVHPTRIGSEGYTLPWQQPESS